MTVKADRSILILLPDKKIEGIEDFRKQHIQSEGKEVPFHITLLPDFYLPNELDDNIISKLKLISNTFPKFDFKAVPISSFPTSKVIYLSPVPAGSIEQLVYKIKVLLPRYKDKERSAHIYHMTLAMGNPLDQTNEIIEDYFNKFDKDPLLLKGGKLAIYIKEQGKWSEYQSFELS
ncbi:MAG TPA: 2'-5' RNA ligase family protein [Halanaerobiales bacterium]|nr:2'-5' RNA ligase family protein [Halanaerobiales bacterium]